MTDTPKTREEVEKLKSDWTKDPCFDLESTEGFEDFHDELLAFSQEHQAKARERFNKQMQEHARRRTAGEIRFAYSGVETARDQLLREIAAQLAELNGHLQLFSVGNDSSYKSLAVTLFEAEKEEAAAS